MIILTKMKLEKCKPMKNPIVPFIVTLFITLLSSCHSIVTTDMLNIPYVMSDEDEKNLKIFFPDSTVKEAKSITYIVTQNELSNIAFGSLAIFDSGRPAILITEQNKAELLHEVTHLYQFIKLGRDPSTVRNYIVSLPDLQIGKQLNIEQEASLISLYFISKKNIADSSILFIDKSGHEISISLHYSEIIAYMNKWMKISPGI